MPAKSRNSGCPFWLSFGCCYGIEDAQSVCCSSVILSVSTFKAACVSFLARGRAFASDSSAASLDRAADSTCYAPGQRGFNLCASVVGFFLLILRTVHAGKFHRRVICLRSDVRLRQRRYGCWRSSSTRAMPMSRKRFSDRKDLARCDRE